MDASRTSPRARSKSEGECEIWAFSPPFVLLLLLLCIYVGVRWRVSETRKARRNRLQTQTIIKAIIDLLELRYAALSVFYSIKVRTHDPKWLVGISERIAQKTVSAQSSSYFRDMHILDESRKSYLLSKSVILAARGTSKMKQKREVTRSDPLIALDAVAYYNSLKSIRHIALNENLFLKDLKMKMKKKEKENHDFFEIILHIRMSGKWKRKNETTQSRSAMRYVNSALELLVDHNHPTILLSIHLSDFVPSSQL